MSRNCGSNSKNNLKELKKKRKRKRIFIQWSGSDIHDIVFRHVSMSSDFPFPFYFIEFITLISNSKITYILSYHQYQSRDKEYLYYSYCTNLEMYFLMTIMRIKLGVITKIPFLKGKEHFHRSMNSFPQNRVTALCSVHAGVGENILPARYNIFLKLQSVK